MNFVIILRKPLKPALIELDMKVSDCKNSAAFFLKKETPEITFCCWCNLQKNLTRLKIQRNQKEPLKFSIFSHKWGPWTLLNVSY